MSIEMAVMIFLAGIGMGIGLRAYIDRHRDYRQLKSEFEAMEREVRNRRRSILGERDDPRRDGD